ncbi:hypothetical protein COPEUT_02274 [Coprococcus eutactus ATCC 27759]|nr:hypothetical protein COPEUT_02274 [Coprococcus eutactus ATCC 27759]
MPVSLAFHGILEKLSRIGSTYDERALEASSQEKP